MKLRNILIVLIIALLAFSYRFLPNVPNFSPIMAIFLFSGIILKNWKMLVGVLGLFLMSDIILNNTVFASYFPDHSGLVIFPKYMIFTVLCYLLIFGLGKFLGNKNSITNVLGLSLSSSLLFFILTNTGAWVFDPTNLYTNDISGLFTSLIAGIPFFRTSVFADLFFVSIFFFIYNFVTSRSYTLSTSEVTN